MLHDSAIGYRSFDMGGWGLFEDVGDLAEIFFVGVGGAFEDGGLRNYLFAN